VILTTLYLVGTKNTDSWCARKGDSQCAFPLDIPMVPSSAITVATDGKHLTCGGFSLGETACIGKFEFIVDYFGGLSLSPRRGDKDTAFLGSTRSEPSTPWGGHNRGLHRGVPHGIKWGRELQPPLSQKAGHGCFARSGRNHTIHG
jgi:hypothetical protein